MSNIQQRNFSKVFFDLFKKEFNGVFTDSLDKIVSEIIEELKSFSIIGKVFYETVPNELWIAVKSSTNKYVYAHIYLEKTSKQWMLGRMMTSTQFDPDFVELLHMGKLWR